MTKSFLFGLAFVSVLSAQEFTRGVGVYPGDPGVFRPLARGRRRHLPQPGVSPPGLPFELLRLQPHRATGDRRHQGNHPSAHPPGDHQQPAGAIPQGPARCPGGRRPGIRRDRHRAQPLDSVPVRGRSASLRNRPHRSGHRRARGWQRKSAATRARRRLGAAPELDSGSFHFRRWASVEGGRPHARGRRDDAQSNTSVGLGAALRSRYYRVALEAPGATTWRVGKVRFFNKNSRLQLAGPGVFYSAWESAGQSEEWVYVDLARCARSIA